MPQHRMRMEGFSLLELLIVLSVIATLAALLYPVIGQAKRRTYVTQCLTQMRQIGIAIKAYQSDYQTEEVPCYPQRLVPQYLTEDLTVCPWVNAVAPAEVQTLKQAFMRRFRFTWTSYFFFCQRGLDDLYARGENSISYSQILMMRGPMTPIAYCREHREPYVIRSNIPLPWYWDFPEQPIVVLRLDGSVHLTPKGGSQLHYTTVSTVTDALEL